MITTDYIAILLTEQYKAAIETEMKFTFNNTGLNLIPQIVERNKLLTNNFTINYCKLPNILITYS